jgi:hypothetical protein
LNEGIAYALAPGLTDRITESDSLAEALVRNLLKGRATSDSYVQACVVALVLRPLLRAALEHGETFTDFLPKAVAEWRTVAGH